MSHFIYPIATKTTFSFSSQQECDPCHLFWFYWYGFGNDRVQTHFTNTWISSHIPLVCEKLCSHTAQWISTSRPNLWTFQVFFKLAGGGGCSKATPLCPGLCPSMLMVQKESNREEDVERKLLKCEKHIEGCEWVCVLGEWPSVKQSTLSSISLWSIMHHCWKAWLPLVNTVGNLAQQLRKNK